MAPVAAGQRGKQQDFGVLTCSKAGEGTSLEGYINNIPEVLEFESWWCEGNTKRYMLVLYYTSKELFEVMVDDSTVPMRVVVHDKKGQPLKPWHLHVGLVIDILGKPTTLMKAKQSTMHWVDTEARRLWDKKTRLETTLSKFAPIPDLTPLTGVTTNKLKNTKAGSLGGTVDLSRLALAVAHLQNEVKLYKDI